MAPPQTQIQQINGAGYLSLPDNDSVPASEAEEEPGERAPSASLQSWVSAWHGTAQPFPFPSPPKLCPKTHT